MLDATQEDITFTTVEYTHTPQAGFPDLFGTFEMKVNPDYDSKNNKSGMKFVRHAQLRREDVLVYNVQTTRVELNNNDKNIKIDIVSLHALAAVMAPLYPVPAVLPASHQVNVRSPPPRPTARAAARGPAAAAPAAGPPRAPRRAERAPARQYAEADSSDNDLGSGNDEPTSSEEEGGESPKQRNGDSSAGESSDDSDACEAAWKVKAKDTIEVFWEDEKQWFRGVCTSWRSDGEGKRAHRILYGATDKWAAKADWHNLARVSWRFAE